MNQRTALVAPLVIAFSAAVLLIVAGCASPSVAQPTSLAATVDDATLNTQILAKIAEDPGLRDLGLKVETFKAVVHLSGSTNTDVQKAAAVRAAIETDGVLRVRDDIVVKNVVVKG